MGQSPRRLSSPLVSAARRYSGAPRPAAVGSSWDPSPRRLAGENPTSTPDPSRLIIHRQCNLRTHNLLKSFSTLAQQRWSAHGVLKGRGWRSGGTAGGHPAPSPARPVSLDREHLNGGRQAMAVRRADSVVYEVVDDRA